MKCLCVTILTNELFVGVVVFITEKMVGKILGQVNSALNYFRLCTLCIGTSYNILRLKGLAGIIFGQPLRGIIIL